MFHSKVQHHRCPTASSLIVILVRGSEISEHLVGGLVLGLVTGSRLGIVGVVGLLTAVLRLGSSTFLKSFKVDSGSGDGEG